MSKEHVDYLKNVLECWKAFCESHRLFAEAILAIVEENESLKSESEEKKPSDKTDG